MAHTEQGPQVTSQLHWPKKAAAAICAGSSVGSRSNRFAREMPAQPLTAALNGLASVTTPTPPAGDRAWSSPRTASQKGSATPEPTHSICAALRVTRWCVCSCWPFLGQSCSPLGLGLPAILTFHPQAAGNPCWGRNPWMELELNWNKGWKNVTFSYVKQIILFVQGQLHNHLGNNNKNN